MEPLAVLAWVGAICASAITVALTILIVWTAIRAMPGKATTKPQTMVTRNGRLR